MNKPKPPPSRRERRIGYLLFFISFGLLLILLATSSTVIQFFWRQARGTRYEGSVVRWHLTINGEQVDQALARGHIYQGQPVEEVIAKYGPFRYTTGDKYTQLEPPGEYVLMFEGYRIVARDGQLVGAGWWTCTGSVIFFDALSPDEHQACHDSIQEARRQRYVERVTPRMAAIGALGYFHPQPPREPDPPIDPSNE